MSRDSALVSVITIFLNEERFLAETIASVYAQSHDGWELLLVDDGSTDGSTAIAKAHAARDPTRVRYLEHPGHENRGMSAARNFGLAAARGELIAFLDADDIWLPNRLARGVALLHAHPEAAMAYGRTQYWYSWTSNADSPLDWVQPHGFKADCTIGAPNLLAMHLLNEAALPCMGSLTVRRQAALDCGGFADAFQGLYEDQAFLARICSRYAVFVAEECWDRYRQHSDSACAVAERRGNRRAAERRYFIWLGEHLEQQGLRGTRVWLAFQFAKRTAAYGLSGWRGRLARGAMRTATRVAMAMHRPLPPSPRAGVEHPSPGDNV